MVVMLAAALLATCVCPGRASATEALLEDFASEQATYPHTLGGEFPGAKAFFAWTQDGWESVGALRIGYDFTQGGRYCQWAYGGWLPERADTLTFHAHSPAGTHLIVRVVDSTGQYHQFGVALGVQGWQAVRVPIRAEGTTAHWGGANDGAIHLPLTRLFIGPESADAATGTLLLDRIAIETDMTEAEVAESRLRHFLETARLGVTAGAPGLLFRPEDEKRLTLSVASVPESASEITVGLRWMDAYGEPVPGLPERLRLTREAGFSLDQRLPDRPGYREASYELTVRAGQAERTGVVRRFAFGVVPPNARERGPDSPFGVNTHFNQGWDPALGRIVKQAGIAWIRDGEANLDDRALPVAETNALCYMPCFTWYRRPLDASRRADGTWDFGDVADWHREYARRCGAHIDAYDLVNEPHGPWSEVLGGDWSGGAWQEAFVQYGRQVTEAIKQGDPGAVVLWEDIDQLLWYRRFQELGAGDVIDVISPHPYNMHRARPLPEEHPILEQLPEFRAFVAQHGLPWEVWAGEVGFSSFTLAEDTPTGFYAPQTELGQANMLVRMMVLQLASGVRRIFWYDFYDDGTESHNPEHNFGLIRYDLTPKPAIVAYAYLISRLRGCRWLGRYAMGGGAEAFAFVGAGTGEPALVAWLRRGQKVESVRVPSTVGEVTVTDIFGASETVSVRDHRLELPLGETPVYVDGLVMEDVEPLTTATVEE